MGAACRTAEVTALDVVYALKRQGKTIYGFGDAARGTGHATLERRIAASPGVCVGYVGFFCVGSACLWRSSSRLACL